MKREESKGGKRGKGQKGYREQGERNRGRGKKQRGRKGRGKRGGKESLLQDSSTVFADHQRKV